MVEGIQSNATERVLERVSGVRRLGRVVLACGIWVVVPRGGIGIWVGERERVIPL